MSLVRKVVSFTSMWIGSSAVPLLCRKICAAPFKRFKTSDFLGNGSYQNEILSCAVCSLIYCNWRALRALTIPSIDEPLAGFHIEPVQRVHTIVADFDGFTDLQWIHFCFYGRAAHDNGRVAMSPVHQLL